MKDYIIYTDGAYKPSLNSGGIGIVFLCNGKEVYKYSKKYTNSTNQRMETQAVITALNSIVKPINSLTIITDSMYVVGTAIMNWKRKANLDLWEKFNSYDLSKFNFLHVKGHNDNTYNEMCDDLAVLGSHLKILY